uniref:Endonuclease/exonuclease/phosphatase domain-containing protein n=1 Tax=Brassica oleracea var. oleracea TaxID=109376 RepID=A0A0D3BU43_BRAOL
MIDFADCLLQAGLFDLRFHGQLNTWTNKTLTDPIAKKLDRLLVNQCWVSLLPQSTATFLSPNFSDHSPCVLDLALPLPISGTRPFKFLDYLTKRPKLLPIAADLWIQTGGTATTLGELCWKLKQIKRVLRKINRENFSKIQERVAIANNLLKIVQGQALQDPSPALFQKERELTEKWEFLRTIEEAYFRQKSRINWLKEGDLNTSYFHRIWKVRTAVNSIRSFVL